MTLQQTYLSIISNQAGRNVGSSTSNTVYRTCVIMRNTGAFAFVKGGVFTYWTLIYADIAGNTTPVYPSIGQSSDTTTTMSVDYIMVPSLLWLPSPIISD